MGTFLTITAAACSQSVVAAEAESPATDVSGGIDVHFLIQERPDDS